MQHRIVKKIEKINYYLTLLDSYKDDCKKRFLNDPMYEGALLHYLYLVSDGSISLAEMVIKIDYLVICEDVLAKLGEIKRYLHYIEEKIGL